MGIDKDFASAYAKAQIAAGQKLPSRGGKVFLTMADKYKKDILAVARDLGNLGYGLVATCELKHTHTHTHTHTHVRTHAGMSSCTHASFSSVCTWPARDLSKNFVCVCVCVCVCCSRYRQGPP